MDEAVEESAVDVAVEESTVDVAVDESLSSSSSLRLV